MLKWRGKKKAALFNLGVLTLLFRGRVCHSEGFCSWEAFPRLLALCSLLGRTEVELNVFIMEKINFCFCFVVFCVCLSCGPMMN